MKAYVPLDIKLVWVVKSDGATLEAGNGPFSGTLHPYKAVEQWLIDGAEPTAHPAQVELLILAKHDFCRGTALRVLGRRLQSPTRPVS